MLWTIDPRTRFCYWINCVRINFKYIIALLLLIRLVIRTWSYKNIFSVDLRYARILPFSLVIEATWQFLSNRKAEIYAEISFKGDASFFQMSFSPKLFQLSGPGLAFQPWGPECLCPSQGSGSRNSENLWWDLPPGICALSVTGGILPMGRKKVRGSTAQRCSVRTFHPATPGLILGVPKIQ